MKRKGYDHPSFMGRRKSCAVTTDKWRLCTVCGRDIKATDKCKCEVAK